MAGQPGRSGGARAGAGRPAKEKPEQPPAPPANDDPVGFLLGVMNDLEQDPKLRVRAAIAAAQYTNVKLADGGKKDLKQTAADKAVTGKFAPTTAPGPRTH